MKVFQRLLSTGIFIFYGIFLLSSSMTAASTRNSTLPVRSYIVLSGSMEPTIMTGDLVLVRPQASYQQSDIITFHSKEAPLITHRIVEVKDGTFITRGDNNHANDPEPIHQEDIVGRYVIHIPKLGYILTFFQKPVGVFILIFIPIIWILAGMFFKSEDSNKNVSTKP